MGLLDDTLGFATLGLAGNDPFSSEGSPAQVVDTTPSQFTELRQPVADTVNQFISGGQSFDPNTAGALTTAPTGNELTTLQALQNQSTNLSPEQKAARDQLLSTTQGAGFDNPFLQGAIDAATRPILNAYERVTLPGLKQGFSKLGQTIRPDEPTGRASSPFNTAAAFAQGDLLNSISDISSRLSFENFNQERNRQLQSAKDLTSLRTEDVNLLMKNLQSQALPRLIEEVGLDRALVEFNNFTDNILAALNIGGTIASGPNVTLPAVPGTPGLFESGLRSFVNSVGSSAGSGGGALPFA